MTDRSELQRIRLNFMKTRHPVLPDYEVGLKYLTHNEVEVLLAT
jgi:hypothetical protein